MVSYLLYRASHHIVTRQLPTYCLRTDLLSFVSQNGTSWTNSDLMHVSQARDYCVWKAGRKKASLLGCVKRKKRQGSERGGVIRDARCCAPTPPKKVSYDAYS